MCGVKRSLELHSLGAVLSSRHHRPTDPIRAGQAGTGSGLAFQTLLHQIQGAEWSLTRSLTRSLTSPPHPGFSFSQGALASSAHTHLPPDFQTSPFHPQALAPVPLRFHPPLPSLPWACTP